MSTLPGIEYRKKSQNSNKIFLKENPVAGFVGVTVKGPLNQVIRITNFNQFLQIFGGFDSIGYLPFSVYSFFQNGGKQCHIVRIAHTTGEGAATCAEKFLTVGDKRVCRLKARSEGIWGNNILTNLWHAPQNRINLTLSIPGFQEDFLDLSLDNSSDDYFVDRINKKSTLVEAIADKKVFGGTSVDELYNSYFCGGREGLASLAPSDIIGRIKSPSDKTGLMLLESVLDINLLAIPDTALFKKISDVRIVHQALINHVENNDGRFALLDVSGKLDLLEVIEYRKKLNSSKAALYYPDLKVIDPTDQKVFSLPPSCAMAGIISDTDLKYGCYYPPGNRFIEGAVALSRPLDKEEMETLYGEGINIFCKIPGRGIKIWGVRTLADSPQWRFINVRRTMSFLSAAIKKGTAWAVFEPNNVDLQKKLIRHVTAYLIDVWRKGYLAGKTPEEAFFVRCDKELNPSENIDAGILTLEVGLCVVKPAEYIVVTLHAEKEHTKVIIDEEVIHG